MHIIPDVGALLDKKYNYREAVELCSSLNNEWRLPTIAELHLLYERKVAGLDSRYWSSSDYVGDFAHYWDFTLEHPRVMANHKGVAMDVLLIKNV
jgi:glycine betaine/choline ABC-type transport system substrate-binding protein